MHRITGQRAVHRHFGIGGGGGLAITSVTEISPVKMAA